MLADALDYLAAWDVRDIQAHVQGMTTAMLEQLEALRQGHVVSDVSFLA